METILAYATSTTVLCAVAFVAGGILWPKIKDTATGVPAGFRTAMNSVEDKAKAELRTAVADVFAKFNPAPAVQVPPPAPPAPPPASHA